MDQRTALKAVRFFGDRLRQRAIRVSRLVLFGSHASGRATEESDIDVLVVSEDFRGKTVFERSRLAGNSEFETIKRFQVPLDVIFMTPEEFASDSSLLAQAAQASGVEG